MINVEVISEYNFWKKNIKNPNLYIKKRFKKINKYLPFNKTSVSLTILLTSDFKMKYLNNKFRKKNTKTDVLSFPFYNPEELKKNLEKKIYLGDIAISYQFVKKRSKITNFNLEFDKLWLHGYLHLLGYDHKQDKDYIKMQKVEVRILKYFHKIN